MPDWIKFAIGGIFLGIIANGAVGDIQDDVAASCITHNADKGRRGASTNRFCICSAERTAGKASFIHKLGYKFGIIQLSSPYSLGKDFGEETDKLCNAIN